MIRLWRWSKQGFLPDPGAILDQSHWMMEAMERVEYEMNREEPENG